MVMVEGAATCVQRKERFAGGYWSATMQGEESLWQLGGGRGRKRDVHLHSY